MQEGITASDEFWDLCAVIELMEPQATADITEDSCYIRARLKLWQRVSLISKMFMCVCIRFMLIKMLDMFKNSRFIQHPDTSLIKETVDEVVKRFHAQMDHVPLLSLYDSDKDVALKVPTTYIKNIISHMICVYCASIHILFQCMAHC